MSSVERDTEIAKVAAELKALDPRGSRIGTVLRVTFDQLYNGQKTGRYRWDQLYRTEQQYCGEIFSLHLQREFEFTDGTDLDYQIAGIDVDCKYSQVLGGWMIPPEARGKICLVVNAEDTATPTWNAGLIRAREEFLNTGANRDAKATLNGRGREAITWLFKDAPLPPNVLLQLDENTIKQVFSLKSGQKRLNELFRSALGRIIGRAAVATVAQQDDYMKRIRGNGGARTALQPEGIIILGQYHAHGELARGLGLPVPQRGESLAVRITKASNSEKRAVRIGSHFWRIAKSSDPIEPAPTLPGLST